MRPRVISGASELTEDGRQQFTSRWQFLVVMCGYSIGFVNIWRFPYLCGKYGGGNFIIPYLLSLVFIAGPLLLYEVALGQWFRVGVEEIFERLKPRCVSLFGVQWAMVTVVTVYYPIVIGYAVVYSTYACKPPWNGDLPWIAGDMNSQRFWDEVVLEKVDDIDAEGWWKPAWHPFLGYSYVWVATMFTLCKGVEGMVNMAKLSFPIAVVLMFFFGILSFTLEDAGAGVSYLFRPDWSELGQWQVWGMGMSQVLFSLSPGMGPGIIFGACVQEHQNTMFSDIMIVMFCNFFFSVFGGVTMFAIMGYMAKGSRAGVKELAQNGANVGCGLLFVVVADGVAQMPGGRLLAILLFTMHVMLGMDSFIPCVETFLHPWLEVAHQRGVGRQKTVCIGCITMWVLGIPFTCRGGSFLLDIFDHYAPVYLLLFVAFCEFIMIASYGVRRILGHIVVMTGVRLPTWLVMVQIVFSIIIIPLTFAATLVDDISTWLCPDLATLGGSCPTMKTYMGYPMAYNIIFGWCVVLGPILYFCARVLTWGPRDIRHPRAPTMELQARQRQSQPRPSQQRPSLPAQNQQRQGQQRQSQQRQSAGGR